MSIQFLKMTREHMPQVLAWRCQEDVSRYMYTDIEYNLENQYRWFEKVSCASNEKYWVISIKGEGAGLFSLHNIDLHNRKASWGYYIGEQKFRMLGAIVPFYSYNYVFFTLGLHKLIAEIMEGNDILKMHLAHGCREVGVHRQHIWKYERFHDVHVVEMLRSDWNAEKYQRYIATFED
jgi:UDP-4-amino-4,6-dideoxy-N-acetyl-beta-L-altrosamine N-acetyltransferase